MVRERLTELAKLEDSISVSDFTSLCNSNNIDPVALSKALHASGSIFHLQGDAQLKNTVWLRPEVLYEKVMLNLGQFTPRQQRIEALRKEFQPLDQQWKEIVSSGHSRANLWIRLSLLGLAVQGGLVARLTWWELSWDIMEPITYMLTFSTAFMGMSYFALTGAEYSYESLHATFARRRREKLIRRHRFDSERYTQLSTQIEHLERAIGERN